MLPWKLAENKCRRKTLSLLNLAFAPASPAVHPFSTPRKDTRRSVELVWSRDSVRIGSIDTNLAVTALAIALVALFVALGQLLQQYFATADGYRRCQRSVMGHWASKTRLRWRWREFRFETLYTTPEIFMTGNNPDQSGQVLITGDITSRVDTLLLQNSNLSSQISRGEAIPRLSNETACWVSLLHQMHLCSSRGGLSDTPFISLPALVLQERSWDFQLPEIVRPLATCTVSDIAIIARRLGMRWKDFRPFDGNMRAEGYFHIMTSTNIRSLGTVLQYSYTWKDEWRPTYRRNMVQSFKKEREEVYMPTVAADRLGFGIIRGSAEISLPHFTLGTQDEVVTALGILDETGKSAAALRKLVQANPKYHLPTADLVAMTMGMARLRGRSHVQVPAPSENMLGFTTSFRGRRAFHKSLKKFIAENPEQLGPQALVILSICEDLRDKWPEWEQESQDHMGPELPVRKPMDFLNAVEDQYDKTTEWIKKKNEAMYRRLLGAHIRQSIFNIDAELMLAIQNPDYGADVEGYFAAWPRILEDVTNTGPPEDSSPRELFDTWVVMLFRACCWGACHCFVPGERVPSAYYGSQLPVYIG